MTIPQLSPDTYGIAMTPTLRLYVACLGDLVAESEPAPHEERCDALCAYITNTTKDEEQRVFTLRGHLTSLLCVTRLNPCFRFTLHTSNKNQRKGRELNHLSVKKEARRAFCEAYAKEWIWFMERGVVEEVSPQEELAAPTRKDLF